MEKGISSKFLNLIVIIGIALTLLTLIGTPLILTAFLKSSLSILDQNLVILITIFIYICAIPYVFALLKLKKITKLVVKNTPFSLDTAKALKTISYCAFSEIFLFNGCSIYLMIFHDTYLYALSIIPMIIVTFVSLALGFISLIFAQLFYKATELKEENDKTI